ncbi:hypothetical protein Goshw_027918 [Gossypium schwendimanii]|uniref:Uncharacterized protein n=1 Tax=Gossypium schwendimanii TaxID=34291 RepID=A0A7J9LZ44_GOSSC|nr:hypothetical protein [Gossypium schwendimanii]
MVKYRHGGSLIIFFNHTNIENKKSINSIFLI